MIRQYAFFLTILAVFMIILRVFWVADVILITKHELKDQADEETDNEEEDENKDSSRQEYFDDYYHQDNRISDKKFLVYFGIQVRFIKVIISFDFCCFMFVNDLLGFSYGSCCDFNVGYMCVTCISL